MQPFKETQHLHGDRRIECAFFPVCLRVCVEVDFTLWQDKSYSTHIYKHTHMCCFWGSFRSRLYKLMNRQINHRVLEKSSHKGKLIAVETMALRGILVGSPFISCERPSNVHKPCTLQILGLLAQHGSVSLEGSVHFCVC